MEVFLSTFKPYLVFSNLRKLLYVGIGAEVMLSSVMFSRVYSCSPGFRVFSKCLMPLSIPATNLVASFIMPISAFLVGAFFTLYMLKFGLRGIPLLLMVAGAYDFIPAMLQGYFSGVITGQMFSPDVWLGFQTVIMIGGYLLAGCPKFKLNKMFFLTAGFLLVSLHQFLGDEMSNLAIAGIDLEHLYVILIFSYVLTSIELRGNPLRSKVSLLLGRQNANVTG